MSNYTDTEMVALHQTMSSLPDPQVAPGVYPNPPWNTVRYDWNGTYDVGTPEYAAQHTAKYALATGLQYTEESEQPPPPPTPPARAAQVETISIRNGVLTDTHLYLLTGGKIGRQAIERPPEHIGDILQLCLDYDVRTVWVLSHTALSERATPDFVDAARGIWGIRGQSYEQGKDEKRSCKFVSAWKREEARAPGQEDGRTCYVGFCQHNTDWGLKNVSSPLAVLATISYLEDVLNVPIFFSAGFVGKELMKSTNETRKEWIQTVDMRQYKPLTATKSLDIAWKRSLSESERSKLFLVAYDKNMTYTSSCTSVLLGSGPPTYKEQPDFPRAEKEFMPGLWHCQVQGSSDFDGDRLPHPLVNLLYETLPDGTIDGWFWSYTVRLLYELGYAMTILEAYAWDHEHAHTILRPFAEKRLWNARSLLDDKLFPDTIRYIHPQARALAAKGVKLIANKSMGWLDMLPGKEDAPGALDLYRPDWYQMLKDNGRYKTFWNIRTAVTKGYIPLGVKSDCLYFASEVSDHAQALPFMMGRQKHLGGFKQNYDAAITLEQVAPLFDDPQVDIAQINTFLLDIEEQQKQKEA